MESPIPVIKPRLLPVTLGVTGHIDIRPEDVGAAAQQLDELIGTLAGRYPHSPLRLVTSLARGADRLAASVFLKKRSEVARRDALLAEAWEVIVPLPLPQSIYEQDFPDSIEEFRDYLARATFAFSLPLAPGRTLEDVSRHGDMRDGQYEDASRYVASHSDILIALWDGRDPGRKGGTCETVRMRLEGHGVTSRLHYSPLSPSGSRVVHHVPVRRKQDTGHHSSLVDLTGHGSYSISVGTTLSLTSGLEDLDQYNAAVSRIVTEAKFAGSIQYSMGDEVRAKVLSVDMGYSRRSCLELFASADALAVYFERRWRMMTKIIYGLGLSTALLLPLAIEGLLMPWTMVGYFLLLGLASCILLFMHRARVENRHIESRALAELLRVQFAWQHSGIEDPSNPADDRDDPGATMPISIAQILLGQQQVDLGWINQAVAHLVLAAPAGRKVTATDQISCQEVVRDWVDGQARYFARSARHAEQRAVLAGRLSATLVIGGLSSALGAILLSFVGHELEFLRHLLVVLSAALPVAGFVVENASERFGIEAQSRMRHRLHGVYERSGELLARPGLDRATRDRLIIETGREAVAESIMWLFLRRIKPVKVSV